MLVEQDSQINDRRSTMADGQNRKPILTVEQQIMHLKQRGVSFELCAEAEAACILAGQDRYFRLAAYRVLFPKHVGGPRDGQYAGLDFRHLVDLAAIDRELRGFLLPLTLDVESSAKTRLIERITEKPGEDGYSFLSDYLAALNHGDRNRREGELRRLQNDAYLGPLVSRYPIGEMPAWVFLELSFFGAFADFYLSCANRWDDSGMRDEHYMLRRANSLRNAAAHSSAIVNGLGSPLSAPQLRYPATLAAALGEIGMSKRLRRSKMRNPRILQMAVLAYAYSRFVPREKAEGTPERLLALADRSKFHGDWYASNTVITSSHNFIARVFEAWLG